MTNESIRSSLGGMQSYNYLGLHSKIARSHGNCLWCNRISRAICRQSAGYLNILLEECPTTNSFY